jgi:hypothetical protein
MSRKSKPKWTSKTLKLKDNHTWKAPPNHVVVVVDRGAVRFNIPDSWHVEPDSEALKLYDKKPPKDDCRLSVTCIHTPPVDWTELPLAPLLDAVSRDDTILDRTRGEIITVARKDAEIVWLEVTWQDPIEHREARSRIAVARGSNVHVVFTLDFWPEDAKRLEPVWKEVLRSIELNRYVSDPLKGDVLQ